VTSSARLGQAAKRTPLAELWLAVQRERALIALFDLGRQKSRGLRAARAYAFGVFVTYAIAIALTRGGAGQRHAIHSFVTAALVALSWVVGALAALGATQVLAKQAEREGLSALARQRGFSERALLRARAGAAAQRIALLVGVPALLLVAVGVARGAALSWALLVAPGIALYACALGLTLALLAELSAELAPRHPRLLLLGLVLGPLLISQAFPAAPSLSSVLSALLAQLLGSGAPS
jgi:hypothetical protein